VKIKWREHLNNEDCEWDSGQCDDSEPESGEFETWECGRQHRIEGLSMGRKAMRRYLERLQALFDRLIEAMDKKIR